MRYLMLLILTSCAPMPDSLTGWSCIWADPVRECALIDLERIGL